MINLLTFAETNLITNYRQKWHQLMISPQTINHDRATLIINEVYQECGLLRPEIIFCSSPYAVALILISLSNAQFPIDRVLGHQFKQSLDLSKDIFPVLLATEGWEINDYLENGWQPTENVIWSKLINKMACRVGGQIPKPIRQRLERELKEPLNNFWGKKTLLQHNTFRWHITKTLGELICYNNLAIHQKYPEIRRDLNTRDWRSWGSFWLSSDFNDWLIIGAWLDYCHEVLGCNIDRYKWSLLKSLIIDCGWLYLSDRFCVICSRPTHFRADKIEFSDGFRMMLN